MCFAGVLTSEAPQTALGWVLIGLVSAMIIYNIIVILYDMWQFVKLYARMIIQKIMRRMGWRTKTRGKKSKTKRPPVPEGTNPKGN